MKHILSRTVLVSIVVSAGLFVSMGVKAQEREMSIEEFLQGLSTVPGAVLRRDPFVESSPPFDVPPELNGEYQSSIPVMERYPLAEYEVVAVLLGDRYPRALVRLPEKEKRKVVVVKLRDKLGNRKGEIIKMTREGLVVQQAIRSKFGFTDKSDVILKVGGTAERQKAELMASQGKIAEKNTNRETSAPVKK